MGELTTIDLNEGDKIRVRGEQYAITKTAFVEGEFIPKPETKQTTYMLKAHCPVCHRIIRVTSKNWSETDARANITCMHKDGNAYNFVLDNEEVKE